MTEWEPATDAEAAMREALRAGDQESYFRILSTTDLLLPVSAEALAGRAPLGWGTWTTGGRTHVLAFTSPAALRACLAEHAGSTRTVAYQELAATWPNLQWWMAVDPGLPIEGYLPAWFVAQLARGDVRLPSRATGAPTPAVPGQPAASQADQPPAAAPGSAPAAPGGPAAAPGGPAAAPGGPPVAPASPAAAPGGPAAEPAMAMPAPVQGFTTPSAAGPPAGAPSAAEAAPSTVPTGRGPGFAAAASGATGATGPGQSYPGGPLPRRPVPSASAQPQSMAEVARSMAAAGTAGHPHAYATPPSPAGSQPPSAAGSQPPAPSSAASQPPAPSTAAPQPPMPAQPWPDRPGAASPGPGQPAAGDGADDGAASGEYHQPGRAGAEPPGVSGFVPANEVEQGLLRAARDGSTEAFLSTLLLAQVLVPVPDDADPGRQPGQEGFTWRTETIDDQHYLVVFTSPQRLADHLGAASPPTVATRFVELIRRWPDPAWSFAVNPGTPVGASLPGSQIVALANWAVEVGLGDPGPGDAPAAGSTPRPAPAAASTPDAAVRPTMMQKSVAPEHVRYYLERGYDRVSGFVHRVNEVEHLRTPAELYAALGLGYDGSPFRPDADEVFVLRWPAYRPTLYRIPYGGQNDAAMRAMEGWVIERAPFRGNGFAPGDSSEVIAEFKVDSTRLPHGARLWRIGADGSQDPVAVFDSDTLTWRQGDER